VGRVGHEDAGGRFPPKYLRIVFNKFMTGSFICSVAVGLKVVIASDSTGFYLGELNLDGYHQSAYGEF
jgi:hypothetical protein